MRVDRCEVEFACDQEDHGPDRVEAGEAAGAAFGGVEQAVERFEESVGLVGLRPSGSHPEFCVQGIASSSGETMCPPGKMLCEDFLPDYGLTVADLASDLGVSRQTANELLRERRAVSPGMTLCLARRFGNSPGFWANVQKAVDLWDAAQAMKAGIGRIRPLSVA